MVKETYFPNVSLARLCEFLPFYNCSDRSSDIRFFLEGKVEEEAIPGFSVVDGRGKVIGMLRFEPSEELASLTTHDLEEA